jgi:hypothetical protein
MCRAQLAEDDRQSLARSDGRETSCSAKPYQPWESERASSRRQRQHSRCLGRAETFTPGVGPFRGRRG